MEILIILYVAFMAVACAILAVNSIPQKEEKWVPSQFFMEKMREQTRMLQNANEEIRRKSLL